MQFSMYDLSNSACQIKDLSVPTFASELRHNGAIVQCRLPKPCFRKSFQAHLRKGALKTK